MGAMANSYQQYIRHDVMMATPMELIVMLYSGCIKRLRLAQIAIGKKDIEAANKNLQKAQDIMMELIMSLDLRFDIAKELMAIYEYVHHEIVRINIKKDAGMVDPLVEVLTDLRESWVQVQKECKPKLAAEYESE